MEARTHACFRKSDAIFTPSLTKSSDVEGGHRLGPDNMLYDNWL